MNLSQFIPAGRTGLVKKGNNAYQIQTEYNYRPFPRLTTTISTEGRVLHKVEKKLDKPIESFEEQALIEQALVRQHTEVSKIIKNNSYNNPSPTPQPKPENTPAKTEKPSPLKQSFRIDNFDYSKSLDELFKQLPGVQHVFQLDSEGYFTNKLSGDIFKKEYSFIFKNIKDLLQIFSTVPGITLSREKGVYVIERNNLYLVSVGDVFYFVTIEYPARDYNYEQTLKTIILHSVPVKKL